MTPVYYMRCVRKRDGHEEIHKIVNLGPIQIETEDEARRRMKQTRGLQRTLDIYLPRFGI